MCNGQVLKQGGQFGIADVEVCTATIDVEEVRSYRGSRPSFRIQAAGLPSKNRPKVIDINEFEAFIPLAASREDLTPSEPVELALSTPEEECLLGPACWLWDYLRRSKGGGFFLPLSGGADSAATATIVYTMCYMVYDEYSRGDNQQVKSDVDRICDGVQVRSAQELCNVVLHTCYMGTANSSRQTHRRAEELAKSIGSCHCSVNIDAVVSAAVAVLTACTGIRPAFVSRGGTEGEDLALQNIQARMRMALGEALYFSFCGLLTCCIKKRTITTHPRCPHLPTSYLSSARMME